VAYGEAQPWSLSWVEMSHSAWTPELHLIDCHRFAAMRCVEERSLSSILRSKFLIALISNDIGREVNAGGRARRLDNFTRLQLSFASGSAETKPLSQELC